MLALCLGRKLEAAAVDRYELVVFVVETVPGKPGIRVGNHDAVEGSVIKILPVRALRIFPAVAPIAIDGENDATGRIRRGRTGSDCAGNHRGSGDRGAGRSEEVASIHDAPSRGAP